MILDKLNSHQKDYIERLGAEYVYLFHRSDEYGQEQLINWKDEVKREQLREAIEGCQNKMLKIQRSIGEIITGVALKDEQ
jgi:hypothetical protein